MKANVSAYCFKARTFGVILLVLFGAGCQFFGGDPAQANLERLRARLGEFSRTRGIVRTQVDKLAAGQSHRLTSGGEAESDIAYEL